MCYVQPCKCQLFLCCVLLPSSGKQSCNADADEKKPKSSFVGGVLREENECLRASHKIFGAF